MFESREQSDKIKGNIDEFLFIIYTKADVEKSLRSDKSTQSGHEDFLNTGGNVLNFSEETHEDI
jgi:hypothetical protein